MHIGIPRAFQSLFNYYRYYVFYGGRGAGKTENISATLVIQMLQENRPYIYACARIIQDSLRDSVKSVIWDKILALGYEDHFYTTRTSNEIICLINDSKFIFTGLSDKKQTKKLKSMHNLKKLWIEECEDLAEENWEIITPSVRAANSSIILSFNPQRVSDFLWRFFIADQPPSNTYIRKVLYTDNPYFNQNTALVYEMNTCRDMYPDRFKRVWEGKPGSFERQLLKEEWWKYYDNESTVLNCLTGMFITADTACEEGRENDYTVIQLWGYHSRFKLFLIDQIRGKWILPDALDQFERFYIHANRLHRIVKPTMAYIEYKMSGIGMVQTLKRKNIKAYAWHPKEFNFPNDKVGRVSQSSILIRDGLVFLPRHKIWVDKFVQECNNFGEEGATDHDDQVDGLTMACSIWRAFGGGN